jgi:hypothetical protein
VVRVIPGGLRHGLIGGLERLAEEAPEWALLRFDAQDGFEARYLQEAAYGSRGIHNVETKPIVPSEVVVPDQNP